MNLPLPLSILTLRFIVNQVCSKSHVPTGADSTFVVIRFLPVRTRAACGYDSTANVISGVLALRVSRLLSGLFGLWSRRLVVLQLQNRSNVNETLLPDLWTRHGGKEWEVWSIPQLHPLSFVQGECFAAL